MVRSDFHVTVLGPLEVRWNEIVVGPGADALKPNMLLTILAVNANQVVSKDELIDALWTTPPSSARNLVEKYVSAWRKDIDSGRLETIGQGYRLNLEVDESDLLASEHDVVVGRGAAAGGDLAAVAVALSRSISRWPNGLTDLSRTAIPEPTRRRLVELYLSTLEEWAVCCLSTAAADHGVLIRLTEAQSHEPLRERLCELRMWCLCQQNRQGEALNCFDDFRRALNDELGQRPGPALSAMHVRVLRQDPTLLGSLGLVPTVNNLPGRHRHFIGRSTELRHLEEHLNHPAHGRRPLGLAVWGLVGAGKSAVILEYAHRHLDDFHCVWWIDAGTRASLAAAFEALANRLGCALPADREQGLGALWSELERRGEWLVIFDNAVTTADMETFWPRVVSGTVLLSSLNPDWRRFAETMAIDVMSIEESVEVLSSRHPESNGSTMAALAGALGRLPLALGQAAAYMDQTGMSAEQYLEMFRRRRAQLLQRGVPDDHSGTIDATWRLACAELNATDPAAVQLLALGSVLGPEHIPFEILRCAPDLLPLELRSAVVDEVGLEDAIRHGRRYSLLTRDGDEFGMHLLVQEVVLASLAAAEQDGWRRCAGRLLARFAPVSVKSRADWPRWEALGPHILVVARHMSADTADPEFVAVLRRASAYYLSRAALSEALTLLRCAVALIESTSGPDEVLMGEVLTELGTVLEQNGNYREALDAQERAVAILQRLSDPEDPWVARALSGLASVLTCHLGATLWKPGELEDAERRLVHSLDVLQTALGPKDPMVARTVSALGQVVQDRGDLVRSRRYFRQAVDILTETYGPEHPETARTYSKLAFLLGLSGEFDRSADLQQRALATLSAIFGTDDIETAWPLSNLALVHLSTGRLDDALHGQLRAHAIFANAAPDGAAAQITAWRVAKVQLAMGEPARAVQTLDPAVTKLRMVRDADHLDVIAMEADLARARAAASPGRADRNLDGTTAGQH